MKNWVKGALLGLLMAIILEGLYFQANARVQMAVWGYTLPQLLSYSFYYLNFFWQLLSFLIVGLLCAVIYNKIKYEDVAGWIKGGWIGYLLSISILFISSLLVLCDLSFNRFGFCSCPAPGGNISCSVAELLGPISWVIFLLISFVGFIIGAIIGKIASNTRTSFLSKEIKISFFISLISFLFFWLWRQQIYWAVIAAVLVFLVIFVISSFIWEIKNKTPIKILKSVGISLLITLVLETLFYLISSKLDFFVVMCSAAASCPDQFRVFLDYAYYLTLPTILLVLTIYYLIKIKTSEKT